HRARAAVGFIVLSASGMMLLVIVGTSLLTTSITRPLARLANAARQFGRGQPAPTAIAARQDEIGELARAFEEMAVLRMRAEAKLRDLIKLGPEAFFLADLDGRYVDVNPAACRLLGYSRDELLQKRIVDLLSPEDWPRLDAERAYLLRPGTVQNT